MEPSRSKAICLPFGTEDQYRRLVKQPSAFRAFLVTIYELHPELFPEGFEDGFKFHDRRHSKRLDIDLRRIKIYSSEAVFLIRPSFIMSYCVARTEDIEPALYLRRWNVPYDALAHVFGRSAKHYERAQLSLGRFSLVGTTIKHAEKLPEHLVADEKHTRLKGEKVFVTTTVAEGCILGANVVEEAGETGLTDGYGDFAREARESDPDYAPKTICLDGWEATQKTWTSLFPTITIVLCFLHSALKLAKLCPKKWGDLRFQILEGLWHVYEAKTKRAFAQRMRRWRERVIPSLPNDWSRNEVRKRINKISAKSKLFQKAFDHEGARRTSNMVDRLMSYQDRLLFAQRYFHGFTRTARLLVRSQALLWNFHPYSTRLRQKDAERKTPFEDLNGFSYHENWLQNLLVAASLGGCRKRA